MAVHLHLESITACVYFIFFSCRLLITYTTSSRNIYENLHTYVLCARGEYKKEKKKINARVSMR